MNRRPRPPAGSPAPTAGPSVSAGPQPGLDPPDDLGGDAACWAGLVCPDCGRLAEARGEDVCRACGADLPPAG